MPSAGPSPKPRAPSPCRLCSAGHAEENRRPYPETQFTKSVDLGCSGILPTSWGRGSVLTLVRTLRPRRTLQTPQEQWGLSKGQLGGGSCCGLPDQWGPLQSTGKSRKLFLVLKPESEAPSLDVGGSPSRHGAQTPWAPPWAGGTAQCSHLGTVCRPGHAHCIPRGSLQPCMQARHTPSLRLLCPHRILPGPSHRLSPGPTGLGIPETISPSPPAGQTEGGLGIWTLPWDPTQPPGPLCTPVPHLQPHALEELEPGLQ